MVAHSKTFGVALIVAISFLLMPASAGTPNSPEVSDPTGDTYDSFLGMPDTSPGTEEIDITAAWFKEVGLDRYRITIEVDELTEDGNYRLGRNIHMWRAEFTTQGHDFNAFIIRNAEGETRGAMSIFDATDGAGAPRTEDGTATVEVNAEENRISFTLPREWSVETTEHGTLDFSFNDGTQLTNIVIRSFDGVGVGTDCFSCVQMDVTDPVDAETFTFGERNKESPDHDNGHGNDLGGCDKSNPGSSPNCVLDPTVVIGLFCVDVPPPNGPRTC